MTVTFTKKVAMSLAALLAAPAMVQVHAFAATATVALGAVQLAGAKGTAAHRLLGWGWVVLMAAVALTSASITVRNGPGHYSFLHGFSALVLLLLPLGVLAARRGRQQGHRHIMVGLFVWALLVTGGFTLMPGRIMHQVVFG
jgi:uncharacterized membrane protein